MQTRANRILYGTPTRRSKRCDGEIKKQYRRHHIMEPSKPDSPSRRKAAAVQFASVAVICAIALAASQPWSSMAWFHLLAVLTLIQATAEARRYHRTLRRWLWPRGLAFALALGVQWLTIAALWPGWEGSGASADNANLSPLSEGLETSALLLAWPAFWLGPVLCMFGFQPLWLEGRSLPGLLCLLGAFACARRLAGFG